MKPIQWLATCVVCLLFASSVSAEEVHKVNNFSFKDLEGNTQQFNQYKGKWVIVNYWATYCGPCIAEIPALNSFAKRYKDKAVVLGMEAGETPVEELQAFVEEKKIAYPVIPTQDSTMFALGLLYGVPTTFIVNPEGEIVDTHMGIVTTAMLQQYLKADQDSSVAEERDPSKPCKTAVC